MLICFKQNTNSYTACGKFHPETGGTTDNLKKTTCPVCLAALKARAERKEAKRNVE